MNLGQVFQGLLGASKLPGAGLKLFLDASDLSTLTLTGSRVDQWRDKSGTGNHLSTGFAGTAFNPSRVSSLFGGRGGVRFLGTTTHFLETAGAMAGVSWSGWTVLIAGQYTNKTTFFMVSEAGSRVLAGAGFQSRLGAGSLWQTVEGMPRNVSLVFGAQFGAGGWKGIRNESIFSIHGGSAQVGTGAFGKLQLGGLVPGGAGAMDVAGVAVWDHALTAAELAQASAYFQRRFGFSALPAASANVVVDGNSLAAGYWGTTNWACADGIEAATGAPGPLDYSIVATSGISTPALISRAGGMVDARFRSDLPANKNVCMVWELTNDLSTGIGGAQAYANVKAYCQARKAAGWKVVVATCLPRSNAGLVATFEADRQYVNSAIVLNAVAEGWADAVAHVGGDATIGAPGASDNTANFNDKIHLTSAGHAIAKTYFTAALNSIL